MTDAWTGCYDDSWKGAIVPEKQFDFMNKGM